MERLKRLLLLSAVLVFGLLAWTLPSLAEEDEAGADAQGLQTEDGFLFYYDADGAQAAGWTTVDGHIYYFRPEEDEDAPAGSAVTGFCGIGKYTFYFDEKGVLATGWLKINSKLYYFSPEGDPGKIGYMYTGLKSIDGKKYYFDSKGRRKTGWITYKEKTYFFSDSKSSSVRGTAVTGWQTIDGERYYFSSGGVLYKDRWIKNKYYVDSEGRMLKNTVTPDGYIVDSAGQKGKLASGFVKIGNKMYYYKAGQTVKGLRKIGGKRYYFNEKTGVRKNNGWITVDGRKLYVKDGVVQTGWQICDGKKYYFSSSGRMVTGKTVDGIEIAEDGTAPVCILLISGHGQGDAGACATYGSTQYQEYKFTRQFSSLIYKYLTESRSDLHVTMYDQNYDCYQVIAGKKQGPDPNFKAYDYVLEIHFNATGTSAKDLGGNGSYKGIGIYVNSAKKDTTLDRKIVSSVSQAAQFPIWGRGTGLFTSSGLLNAKTCQGLGVSYGLLETAFIDDKDDMTLYNSKKEIMAEAAANAISEYFPN